MPRPLYGEFDNSPFSTSEKQDRYRSENFCGAYNLNWFSSDPTLRSLLDYYLEPYQVNAITPELEDFGALMGNVIARRADLTDKNPPRLIKYDKWGHDISEIEFPQSFLDNRSDILSHSLLSAKFRKKLSEMGINSALVTACWSYLLDQAEIAMACALGTGGNMVVKLSKKFAPDWVVKRLEDAFGSGEMSGEAAQMLTERTGGSDLGVIETVARKVNGRWSLSGMKWFVSNANAKAFVALAKIEGHPDSNSNVFPFLLLWEKEDGSRNGILIRRLKDKLGTKGVASAEIELRDAEGFLLAHEPGSNDRTTSSTGLSEMMRLTNEARLGIAMMGLGVTRRALVESLLYVSQRKAFSRLLKEHPLIRLQLSQLIIDFVAAQAFVFHAYVNPMRLSFPLVKLQACRLGINAASCAIEIHGGNGYIEDWPLARLLRDAQVNTVWEGPDNILYLDVIRAIKRNNGDVEFFDHVEELLELATIELGVFISEVKDRLKITKDLVNSVSELDTDAASEIAPVLSKALTELFTAAILASHTSKAVGENKEIKAKILRLYLMSHFKKLDSTNYEDEIALNKELVLEFESLKNAVLVSNN